MASRTEENDREDSSQSQAAAFDENRMSKAIESHEEEKVVKIGNKGSARSARLPITTDQIPRSDSPRVKGNTWVMPHAEYQPSFDMFHNFEWK